MGDQSAFLNIIPMLRSTIPLARQCRKVDWGPDIPRKIQTILFKPSNGSLDKQDSAALNACFMGNLKEPPKLSYKERRYIIDFLSDRRAYPDLNKFGRRYLYSQDRVYNFVDKVSFIELRQYLHSLLRTKNTILIDQLMSKVIAQFSIAQKEAVTNFINSAYVLLHDEAKQEKWLDATEPLVKWAKWMKLLNGHCNFTDYTHQRKLLKTLMFTLRESRDNEIEIFQKSLNIIKTAQGVSSTSQFASTLIYLSTNNRSFDLAEAIWDYKVENNLPIESSDLTCILKCYCHFKKYNLVEPTHSAYPEAQDEHSQFDYLLIAHSKLENWSALRDQFNALFNIGELPNIKHYGIVMYSMATIGELENVEKLYAQLLRRDMLPTYAVLQSLLYAHYKVGDLNACFAQFELFDKYSIRPSSSTYTLMFKVFRGLSNIEGALRLLKRITESDVSLISETHFALLIHMCAKFTNPLIAHELFHVMTQHYDIRPTSRSVAALMDVYIESGNPEKALSLFNEYNRDTIEGRISLFNKAIKAYITMGDQHQCEVLFKKIVKLKLASDSEFFNVMLRYLVCLKRDYDSAEKVIDQMLIHPTIKPDVTHFQVLMDAYDKISFREGIHHLYRKMNENEIPVNSKVLHYLIKATFKVQMRSQGDLEQSIELLDRIMKNAAERTLDITFGQLHPSIVAWPMRAVAKYHSPMKALDLLNHYSHLFYPKEDFSINSKFSVMRSLLVVSAEIEQWDEFDSIFERYIARAEALMKAPSATTRNKKLNSLFKGLLVYKVRHLAATQKIYLLPELLKKLSSEGYVIDNLSWNEAVKELFQDSRTIESGLQIINEKLIHGFNLIHKYRLLKRHAEETNSANRSWFLRQKRADPKSFQPTLYLSAETYSKTMEYMDRYLSSLADLEGTLRTFIKDYPYFMKSYLMKPRTHINGWDKIEADHASYFSVLRQTKRVTFHAQF